MAAQFHSGSKSGDLVNSFFVASWFLNGLGCLDAQRAEPWSASADFL